MDRPVLILGSVAFNAQGVSVQLVQQNAHAPFDNLNDLLAHQAHLAVFLNFIMSNCDPAALVSSILSTTSTWCCLASFWLGLLYCFWTALQFFYLITEIYMNNGSLKEMQRWAYEIHSSFIVPGSPLQINPNLDQTAIDEIDR